MTRMNRRAFNTGLLGFLGAFSLLGKVKLPAQSAELPEEDLEPEDEAPDLTQQAAVLSGKIASQPILKNYMKSNGELGYRCFLRVAVQQYGQSQFFPVVAWGDLALRLSYRTPGESIQISGRGVHEIQGGREWYHIEAEAVRFFA